MSETERGAALKIMEDRLTCLRVAQYWKQEQLEVGGASRKDAHECEFTKYKMSSDVLQQLRQSDNTEPYDKLSEVQSLSFVLCELENIVVNSNADVKTEKQRLRDTISKYTALITHVAKQTLRIANAVKKHLENEEKEQREQQHFLAKEKAEGRQRSQASGRLAAAGQGQRSPEIVSYAVLKVLDNLPKYGIKPVRDFKEPDDAFLKSLPSVCHNFSKLKEAPDAIVKLVETFVNEEFKKNKSYTGSGRGAQITQHQFAIDAGKFIIGGQSSGVFEKLSLAEKQYCQSAWMFAYATTMKSCAPEFGFLGSLKWTFKGTRNVLLCSFDGACRYATAACGEKEPLTPARVCQLVQEATEDKWPALIDMCGADGITRVHLEEGSLLYVPAGWIVAEDVVNGCDCMGIRWLFVPPTITPAFQALCDKVLPSDKSTLKPSSAAGFLNKILVTLTGDQSKKRALEVATPSNGGAKAQKT